MDVVTHGLASYALTRAIFPRVSSATTMGVIVAGTFADLDAFSAQFGPAAFLNWHRTYLHSFTAALALAILVCVFVLAASLRRQPPKDAALIIFFAAVAAAVLHVAMDFCQNQPVKALWPFRARRYSADCVPHFDLWILLILLAGVLLPLLFRLVHEEIGAKSKKPRGRIGATLALAALIIYIGARATFHANALGLLNARTYNHEPAQKVAAFALPTSPLSWRGIVDTERALHEVEINLATASPFNSSSATTVYKPENSPPLESAQNTETVRHFLRAARFPKATVEKTESGYRVEVHDFSNYKNFDSGLPIMAVVETDDGGKVTHEVFQWASNPR